MGDVLFVAKLATTPVTTPRTTEAQSGINPDAGVAATSPEIQPEHHPTMDHFLASLKSSRHHVAAATIAVRHEFQQATTALRFAPNELPPLNPSQPNHSSTVPRVIKLTLCGRKLSIIFSWRLPRTML